MAEIQDPLSFGDLKDTVKNVVDRGRDSTLDDTIVGTFVNGAEQYICNELGGNARFLEDTEAITLTSGSPDYTFRTQVDQVISLVDKSNVWKLEYVERERFNAFVVDASFTTGSSLYWTRFGYERRTNQESPQQQYGAVKIQDTPQPTSDVTLYADEILRAGYMVDDEDMPVLPSQYHFALVEVAAWFASARDVGSKAFREHQMLAQIHLQNIKRAEIRKMSGNDVMLPREKYERLAGGKATITPPTRFAQLRGGM